MCNLGLGLIITVNVSGRAGLAQNVHTHVYSAALVVISAMFVEQKKSSGGK
jgi:hypothetical protein